MIKQAIIKEIEHEAAQTKKILERVPFDKFNWKPHDKSMHLGRLAVHIAEIAGWTSRILSTSEINVAEMKYNPTEVSSTGDIVKLSEARAAKAVEDLQAASDEELMQMWTLRNGEHIIFSIPRIAVIRNMAMNHLVHHRGQLSVYLRLLDVPVPGMYGPSADDTL